MKDKRSEKSRSRHRRRESPDSKHRSKKKNRQSNNEKELRKKQERLAKARLLLMQEEENASLPVKILEEEVAERSSNILKDELESEEEVLPAPAQDNTDELDLFMENIQREAEPQELYQQSPIQSSSESNPENESYHQQFIDAFTLRPQIPAEAPNKPEILIDYDNDTAWDRLLRDDDSEAYLKAQRNAQEKNAVQDKASFEYEPFRKDLYIPCPELARLDIEQVAALREEIGDIKVRGKRCPAPIINWFQCGLSDLVLSMLEKKKFKGPFPIQAQAIPAIMSGRDVIGIAETGSGKTLAYLLPMLRHIADQRVLSEGEGPIALILAPTRELVFQIYNEAKHFCKHKLNLRCACVYGGAGLSSQLGDLRRGCEIVVCTPGRMIDILSLNNGKITNLRRVTYLVIDEADRMFDLGFEPQIKKVIEGTRSDRQTVMFSATFPRAVERLAKTILQKPVEIVVGTRNQTCSNVEQFVEVLEDEQKFNRLLELLDAWATVGKILIFVERQSEVDDLFKLLLKDGYECLALHGKHDQTDRDFTISDFKHGDKTILIATSIAARGLDVKNLVLVVNYMCPNHMEDYIHRIGRTGRAGNKGTAITFVTSEDGKYTWELIKLLKASGQEVPEDLRTLSLEHKLKVEEGEAKAYKSSGYRGKGFNFTSEEQQKVKKSRLKMKKEVFSDSDTDKSDVEEPKKKKSEMTLAEYLKEPKVKTAAISAGQLAAKAAILSGNKHNALSAAKEAIEMVVMQMKKEPDPDEGLENVLKIRDEWVSKTAENSGKVYIELDINDYPFSARTRVMSRDYLNTINDLTGCNIAVRGTYVDPNKKTGIGQSRLHLFIEGPDKLNCINARNEIKRFLEDISPNYAMS